MIKSIVVKLEVDDDFDGWFLRAVEEGEDAWRKALKDLLDTGVDVHIEIHG